MKKILFLTNSEALRNLVIKNKNYEFVFADNEENLQQLLSQNADFALLILDEKLNDTARIGALPVISFFADISLQQAHLLTKPIHITNLFSKIDDLCGEQQKKIYNIADCTINLESRYIQKSGQPETGESKLTELEAKILDFFLTKNSEEKTKSKILSDVWNYKNTEQMTDTGIVEVTINKLRKKLREFGIEEMINLQLN